MSHDGGPSPMYWVIWSVSESPDFSRFSVHNMGFPYCSGWCMTVSAAWVWLQSVGDP